MNLIAELPGLDEMEQQADPAPWYAGVHPDDCDRCEDCDPDEEGLCDNPIRPGAVQVIDPDVIYSVYANIDTSTLPNCQLTAALRNAAPSMIAALKQIHAGDSEKLEAASAWLRTTNANRAIIEAMDRVVAMAKLMEGGA